MDLQIFTAPTGHNLRGFLLNGDPHFFAADVCRALEIGNPSQALERLDPDEHTLISTEGIPGARNPQAIAINEPGLYALILGSRKAEAKVFKRWVTHEVIPSIRKTGGYQLAPLSRVEMARRQLEAEVRAEEAEKAKALAEEELEAAQPAIAFKERVEANATDISLQGCAKKLELNFHTFKQYCLKNNILRVLDGRMAPTHYSLKMGYIRDRTTFAGFSQAMVTPKGVTWINNKTRSLPRLAPCLDLGFLDKASKSSPPLAITE